MVFIITGDESSVLSMITSDFAPKRVANWIFVANEQPPRLTTPIHLFRRTKIFLFSWKFLVTIKDQWTTWSGQVWLTSFPFRSWSPWKNFEILKSVTTISNRIWRCCAGKFSSRIIQTRYWYQVTIRWFFYWLKSKSTQYNTLKFLTPRWGNWNSRLHPLCWNLTSKIPTFLYSNPT